MLEDDQFDPVEQHAQQPAQLQGARARVHRENHSLPLRKGVATPAQVAATENALSILLRLLRNSRLDPSLLRAGLTIRLMLDLGRSAAQLSGLRRISLASEKSCPAAEWGLVAWANEGSPKFGWWLPAGVHTDPKRADIADRGAVWLPLLERTKPWLSIAGLLEDCCEPSPLLAVTPREAKLDAAAFQAWAKATLGPFARALPRVDRLPGTVIEKLAWAATGDRTLGKQIAGQDLEHSAARSYYTSLSVPKAAMLYAKAIASPVSDLSLVAQADNCGRIAIPSFAGSAFTRASESGRVCDIRSTLELLGPKPDQRQNDSELITSHNKLVARLWILLALSTATFLLKHQDGAIHIKNLKNEVARKLRAEPPRVKTGGIGSFQRGRPGHDRTKVRPERKPKTMRKAAVWPTNAMLVYLLLLAEAGSSDDVPEVLVKGPAKSLGIDVSAKISAFREAKNRKIQEAEAEKLKLEREAEEAQRLLKDKVNKTRLSRRKENWEKQLRGEPLCEVIRLPPRAERKKLVQPRREKT